MMETAPLNSLKNLFGMGHLFPIGTWLIDNDPGWKKEKVIHWEFWTHKIA